MKKIRIAQIGIGHNHASSIMNAVRKYPDIYEVVGYAETDPAWISSRAGLPEYKGLTRYGIETLLSMDLDAVLVECDVWNLVPTAMECIKRGLHVHMDKPAGESLEEYAALLRMAKVRNLSLHLGYMYRYNPAYLEALRLIESGRLGDIVSIDAMMSTYHSAEYRRWLEHFKGGTMYIFGCHLLDLILRIQGEPQEILSFPTVTGFDGTASADNDLALLRYPHGFSTVRTSSVEVNGYGRRQMVICGTKGTIEIKPMERPTKMYVSYLDSVTDHYADCREEISVRQLLSNDDRYDDMMLDFASCIKGQSLSPYTPEYELALQKMILAASGVPFDRSLSL